VNGATAIVVEPAPGTDGRAFVAYKVTNPSAGVWHYEYAVYNMNLDRAIHILGFHVRRNIPAGLPTALWKHRYSSTPWASTQTGSALT
jgi:hypothetical protein